MIIFDLDGTLADCEHRRHFVDASKNKDYELRKNPTLDECVNSKYIPKEYIVKGATYKDCVDGKFTKFNPDWKSFYEACDKDIPIEPVISYWDDQISLGAMAANMIWSGRCESVREKTEKWLNENLVCFNPHQLKMRPIGNTESDEVLKERWLDESIAQGHTIDFVFDDRPKVIRMWRRRGIFVFNCCQHDEEF